MRYSVFDFVYMYKCYSMDSTESVPSATKKKQSRNVYTTSLKMTHIMTVIVMGSIQCWKALIALKLSLTTNRKTSRYGLERLLSLRELMESVRRGKSTDLARKRTVLHVNLVEVIRRQT